MRTKDNVGIFGVIIPLLSSYKTTLKWRQE